MTSYFLKSIQHLRQREEILLYGNILHISEEEKKAVVNFLASEYHKESFEYPFYPPDFDEHAGLWAAHTIYMVAQWILYREHTVQEIKAYLPEFSGEITASTILSADLVLRFLPNIITQVSMIDPEDSLKPLLVSILHRWHYSGVTYPLNQGELGFETIIAHSCVHQLYIDRVIDNKKLSLAKHPALFKGVKNSLGMFATELWAEIGE